MEGDFFIGAAIGSTLTKLALRFVFVSVICPVLTFQRAQVYQHGARPGEAEQVHCRVHVGHLLHHAPGLQRLAGQGNHQRRL